jgi:transcriptional regulator with XRE-family HTH domain
MSLSIDDLGRLISAKRGSRGVRAAAADVGVSPATLSRVENGHLPDLATFAKICHWLERDPREFLGMAPAATDVTSSDVPSAVVHFRKKRTVSKETAVSLGELILSAQRAIQARNSLIDQ